MPSIAVPTDAAAIKRGKHLATSISDCAGCHGANLAGGLVIDSPQLGRIVAPNLMRGKNGFGAQLNDADFARAIRYGVLPSSKSVPPVDSNQPSTEFKPLARVLLAAVSNPHGFLFAVP